MYKKLACSSIKSLFFLREEKKRVGVKYKFRSFRRVHLCVESNLHFIVNMSTVVVHLLHEKKSPHKRERETEKILQVDRLVILTIFLRNLGSQVQ